MKKGLKILIVIGVVVILIAIAIVAVVILEKDSEDKIYEDKYLDSIEVSKTLENVFDWYVDNDVAVVDEQGRKLNTSSEISKEKFILDKKIGMYDFSVVSDFESSTLEFVIKNHTKEKVQAFKYRLQFLNQDGSIFGTIDLDSKEIPALAKYKVKVNIDTDIADVYNVVPVTDFEEYGSIGGGEVETK